MTFHDDLAGLAARLRAAGLPVTVQRRRLLEALIRHPGHPTAEALYEAVCRELPGLSRATVYRTLETLAGLGLVRRLSHPDGVVRYDPVTRPHHHLRCTVCGRVEDLPAERWPLGRLRRRVQGYRVERATLLVEGVCPACQKRTAKGERA